MRNIKLEIEYDGGRYEGWQKQAGRQQGVAVQEKLEDVLRKMTQEEIELIGAARTEAGVHAYAQIANFRSETQMKLHEIKHYMNRYLPRDIAVTGVWEAPERFHAAFHAKAFLYEYRIGIGEVPSVFERRYSYYSFDRLDIRKMQEAAAFCIGRHDFRAFSDNRRMKKSTEREIFEIDIYGDPAEILIPVKRDDFRPNMVRILVGTLMQAGNGAIAPARMKEIIQSRDRSLAGETAEARGLFLRECCY